MRRGMGKTGALNDSLCNWHLRDGVISPSNPSFKRQMKMLPNNEIWNYSRYMGEVRNEEWEQMFFSETRSAAKKAEWEKWLVEECREAIVVLSKKNIKVHFKCEKVVYWLFPGAWREKSVAQHQYFIIFGMVMRILLGIPSFVCSSLLIEINDFARVSRHCGVIIKGFCSKSNDLNC